VDTTHGDDDQRPEQHEGLEELAKAVNGQHALVATPSIDPAEDLARTSEDPLRRDIRALEPEEDAGRTE